MPKIVEIDVMPLELNRNAALHTLQPNEARVLQNTDVLWMSNQLRRGPGWARTQVWPAGTGSGVVNSFVFTRRDCRLVVVDHAIDDGAIRLTPSDGTVNCTGPLPLWSDASGSGNNVDTDGITEPTGT